MSAIKIRRALISVSDKTGLVEFARRLHEYGVEMISTGGTLRALNEAGIPAVPVEEVTRFPEMMEGRVKTLHPKIHGGLLYRRDKEEHCEEARRHEIEPIDMVIVNLYPFEKVTQDPGVSIETAIENIDIGGPSMLRSAAKNADAVAVICDPADYGAVIENMAAHDGALDGDLRRKLAVKVFARTAEYDQAIASFLKARMEGAGGGGDGLPQRIDASYTKLRDLRYGENPHQRAALYGAKGSPVPKHFESLHGKELSYNNLLDIEGALEVLREFGARPVACVIKHSNPCGIAAGKDTLGALAGAIESDPLSAFGGIVGMNQPCSLEAARLVFEKLSFFEILIAPSFDEKALEFLKARKNLRLIETGALRRQPGLQYRFMPSGGLLVQDEDPAVVSSPEQFKKDLKFVTKASLAGEAVDDLIFAFQCVKTVKSNAIVLTQGGRTVGIGAGQMSRVDSVEIACRKAGERSKGAFLASDAFFPMPDNIEVARRYGIKAIIQPGGSVKDAEVIEACDRSGIAMAFTGKRHFKH